MSHVCRLWCIYRVRRADRKQGDTLIDLETPLIERIHQGDPAAFEELFLRHYEHVYRVVYGLLGSREEAEDIAQETFLALYRQPPDPHPGAGVRAWLCRVALNRSYNALRDQRRARHRLERAAEPVQRQADVLEEVLRGEERARVREILKTLPERQSQLLLLRYAGLSYAETAAVLDLAPGSVGTLLARAERAFLAAYERLTPITSA